MIIKNILSTNKEIKTTAKGWVVLIRGNKNIKFININDGTTFKNLQLIIKDKKIIKDIEDLKIGSSIIVEGKISLTPEKEQHLELQVEKIKSINNCNDLFPIQKQKISLETLRTIPHIRHRSNIFRSIMKIRSTLALEIHNFFEKKNFLYFHSPIITSNDGEGAGEVFQVDSEKNKDFFGKNANLGVTGQLHAEAYAQGFKRVYTFAPTFRAEISHTKRHISEFWMVEPEIAFMKMKECLIFVEEMLKTIVANTFDKCQDEFKYLDQVNNSKPSKNIKTLLNNNFLVMDYKNVLNTLKEEGKFKESDLNFGAEITTEMEKEICRKYKKPVFIINFPREIKAFYMHQNSDNKTVAAFDLLVPEIGEIVGGSQREKKVNKLLENMKRKNINPKDFEWYVSLRKFGNSGSTGFGLGFERLLMFITATKNIKDVIPFPRSHKNLKM